MYKITECNVFQTPESIVSEIQTGGYRCIFAVLYEMILIKQCVISFLILWVICFAPGLSVSVDIYHKREICISGL